MFWRPKAGVTLFAFIEVVLAYENSFAATIRFDSSRNEKATLTTRSLHSARSQGIEINLRIPSMNVDSVADGFSAINVDGLVPMVTAGNPELATTGTLIAVPNGFEPEVTIESVAEETVNALARPAQKRFRCGGGKEAFEFNASLYQQRGMFPESLVTKEEVGQLQGVRLVRIGINPLRQVFSNRTIRVATELKAKVLLKQVSRNVAPVRLTRPMFELVRSVAANGYYLGNLVRAEGGEVMLVVVADSLKNSLNTLVTWKQAKGIKVDVVTTTEAGGTKEKIKEYVQKYYDTAQVKPSYLLFVGNKTTTPTYMESTGSGNAASDYRYALLAGNDDLPDAFYGRLTADNEGDVAKQLNRWIEYEKSPEAGDWYNRATTIASNEGSGPSDKEYAEQIQGALKAFTYKHADQFYQGEQTAKSEAIKASLAEGRTWIAYFGHGSGTSWGSTNDTFNNSTVETLQNGGRLPVIIDVACQNGSWVNIAKCFGKTWVTHTSNGKNAGAVAFYGGSVNISWHPPAVMSVGVAKYHFEKPVHSLGGSVMAGQLYLIEKMGNGNDTLDNLKWYNLLGDPSLVVRTDVPKAYDLKHNYVQRNGRVEVEVTATDNSGAGVSDVLVSLAKPEAKPLAVAKTNDSGTAVLVVNGVGQLEPGTVLTSTGYNKETYQVNVD